ncbi:AMP-binding protein [Candidatus Bathyarchaeota archaeon]|nr:AMP-binding protein [Candidatus Bathyarchaeota archaeon]
MSIGKSRNPELSTNIPDGIKSDYFQPLEYGDPATYFPVLGKIIDEAAANNPDDVAVIDIDEKEYTFREIHEKIDKLAAGFLETGCTPGSKICICMPSRVEWEIAFLAALKVGIVVPADDWVPPDTTKYIIDHAGIKHVVCLAGKAEELVNSGVQDVTFITVEGTTGDSISFKELVSKAYPSEMQEKLDGIMENQATTDTVFILYTSGTTGRPKGAMLTHSNIAYNMSETARYLEMSRVTNDKVHCSPPFSHCFGNIFGIMSAWYSGIPLAIMDKFDPRRAVEQISRLELTITYGTPTQFRKMLPFFEDPAIYKNRTFRTGIMAGEPCPPKLIKKLAEDVGSDIRVIYGLTEASPGTNCTRATDPPEKKWTVGRAYRGSVVRIEDPLDGEPVPHGEEGEVVIYGPGVMKGYYNAPEKTALVTSKLGGLKTGDIGIMDEEGYLIISGRIKNMIIRGGNNLYPVLIESRMMQIPEFLEKAESIAIVGVKDDMYGEEVGAVVKSRKGDKPWSPQEFIDICFENSQGDNPLLSHEEVPRYAFIDDIEIPVSGRNKVLKNKLTKRVIETVQERNIQKTKPTALQK